jgi:hypothetical protein
VGLLHSKLKEFLNLEQGNHFMFNYTRQFNTLAQYGSYHVDTDEKKVNLYRKGLIVHLQERLVVLAVLLRSTTWCIPHLGVSCADFNSSSIGEITRNTNSGSSNQNSNSNCSVVLLLHLHSR